MIQSRSPLILFRNLLSNVPESVNSTVVDCGEDGLVLLQNIVVTDQAALDLLEGIFGHLMIKVAVKCLSDDAVYFLEGLFVEIVLGVENGVVSWVLLMARPLALVSNENFVAAAHHLSSLGFSISGLSL